MKAITIGFHDVLDIESIPPGAVYTVRLCDFDRHLRAIQERQTEVRTIHKFCQWGNDVPTFITFDDGTSGAYTLGAKLLEAVDWRGHFFVATDWIGRDGYMDRNQIRDLHMRGHVIGSHSCSHPERMSSLTKQELIREWKDSCAILADIVGSEIRTASVAGGYYSRKVAEAASLAGLQVLFTSEPVSRTALVDGCLVLGRYSIQSFTAPVDSGAIVAGSRCPRWKQLFLWNTKRVLKAIGGDSYVTFRRQLLSFSMSRETRADSSK